MLQEWLSWHHLIFLLPLTVAVLMLGLAGLSDLHLGHGGGGVDTSAGTESDADPHLLPVDAGHAHDAAHTDSPSDNFHAVLELFGVGHVPLSLLLQTVAILWGGVGLLMVQLSPPAVALPVAAVATLLGARALAVALGRLMGTSLEPIGREQLVGRTGEVVLEVNPRFGVVHVRDERGTLYRLNARSDEEVLAPGRQVVVVGYDPQGHQYEVADPVRYLETGGN